MTGLRVLGISGSLRAQSTNTALLRAAALLAPPEIDIVYYDGLGDIPLFNPDLERDHQFQSVYRLREEVAAAAAVLFSTPEYAHGVPGALKNALDWIVGTGELSEKPVALVNASSRGVYAQASLREILTAMNARLMAEGDTTVNLAKTDLNPAEIASRGEVVAAFQPWFRALLRFEPTPEPHS